MAVLFSGGIDSTIITYLAHMCLTLILSAYNEAKMILCFRHLPINEPIDLLNVAFENPRKIQLQTEGHPEGFPKQKKRERMKKRVVNVASPASYIVPDRVTGLEELEELRKLCPGRVWNFVGFVHLSRIQMELMHLGRN